MVTILLVAGGAIFCILELLHLVYTLADTRRPRRMAPNDPAVVAAMAATGVRLVRGGTTMWRAWLGFNFSHSLGAVIFGAICAAMGILLTGLALPKAALLIPVAIGAMYLVLAIRYWFWIPATGIGVSTLCLAAAWLAYQPS